MNRINNDNIKLTSSEMGNLWATYMANDLSKNVLQYYLKHIEDQEIKDVLEQALNLCINFVGRIKVIFEQEKFPIPQGFTKDDVNWDAPRLFSDPFYLLYLKNLSRISLNYYSTVLPNMARIDVRDFFVDTITSSTDLYKKVSDVLLSKGLFVRPPYIPIPEKIDFVKKQSFLNGFFGDRRPLHAMEISQVYANIQFNAGKKELMTGFIQVAKTKEIKDYFIRGKEIISKQLELFGKFLVEDDLSLAVPSVNNVTNSTISTFSDKLMLFKITSLSAAKIRLFGDSLSVSMRHDVLAAYSRSMAETANYVEDGTNILIEHGWLEQMPLAANRTELAKM